MFLIQLLNDSEKKISSYYRKRIFAYSVLFFITTDFIPLIYSAINNFSNDPFLARDKVIGSLPWMILIIKGLQEGFKLDKSDRGFFYSLWEPFSAESEKINNRRKNTKINHNNINSKEKNKAYDPHSSLNFLSDKQSNSLLMKETMKKYKEDEFDSFDIESGSEVLERVEFILSESYKNDFSDIHIEPNEYNYKIRVRKDGILQNFINIKSKEGLQLVASLKNLADMDVSEKRASQDGKIYKKYKNKKLEFRCSTVPVRNGESMVLRLLKSHSSSLDLNTLIDFSYVRNSFRDLISLQNGIIIVSGLTGSGKSTTLAAALREIDNGENKIVTAEDPIEYDLGGDIVQTQVNKSKNQTFPYLLRTFMRHDPDVILIGETRDPETANASMDASETGHLVFTTLHSNSAASSLTRLLDMEVPRYKLNTSVRGVLAQRLVRRVCNSCSELREITQEDSNKTGIKSNTLIRYASVISEEERNTNNTIYCEECMGIGYKGRIGVYELLIINRNIKNAITKGMTDLEIQDIAIEDGMITLREYGKQLIFKHLTTISELERVCKK
ncbi:GspE/PulE family protein [Prochlorococcus marinus]|uniref:GspE/PulE family protein n=1 Tax=Prochlorococcus marinus TaxID=1219 RepID=UPI0022B579EC|nr:GspE/PulE family protein [Prochlorococcus marinus]